MKNPIEYALGLIYDQVDRNLLERAFRPHPVFGYLNTQTTEAIIRRDVIQGRVMQDLDIIGGELVTIPLGRISYTIVENAFVYVIPLSMTQGRHINSVLSVEYFGDSPEEPYTTDEIGKLGQQLIDAHRPMQSTGSARVQLVGPNTVALFDFIPSNFLFLRCSLENDSQLQNLSPRYYRSFGKLCVLATEMITYTRLNRELGDGSNNGGSPNSYLRSALDQMADAKTMYEEELDLRWSKHALLNDALTHRRLTTLILP